MTDLDMLLQKAKAAVEAMSPAEREAMFVAQRESFGRSARPAGHDMTREQIEGRLCYLDSAIRNATGWGGALSAMDEERAELQRSLRMKP